MKSALASLIVLAASLSQAAVVPHVAGNELVERGLVNPNLQHCIYKIELGPNSLDWIGGWKQQWSLPKTTYVFSEVDPLSDDTHQHGTGLLWTNERYVDSSDPNNIKIGRMIEYRMSGQIHDQYNYDINIQLFVDYYGNVIDAYMPHAVIGETHFILPNVPVPADKWGLACDGVPIQKHPQPY